MLYTQLGYSQVNVSRVCLGSMTWGLQNNQQDANQQIEYAASRGVNFLDTAEMYAVPPSPDTYGKTESIIGNYFAANPTKRKDWIVATKIAGPGLPWVRGGEGITGEAIYAAVDASLKRLQTDYIDLYQLHWPNRTSPHFGNHMPNEVRFSDINAAQHSDQMLDILTAVDACIKAGKIRHFGLSDDTPWGISKYLQLAKENSLPKVTSIQNEFNLLHSKDWPYLIEQCIHEEIAYLPWSPLAGGMLSGKYLNGARPEGSRWTLMQRNGLFRNTEQSEAAINAYCQVARDHGISPSQLALAWCDKVDGVTSTIIGATSLHQLTEDIDAFSLTYSDQLHQDIAHVLRQFPAPF